MPRYLSNDAHLEAVKLPERCEKMRRLKNVPWVILLLAGFVAGSTMVRPM